MFPVDQPKIQVDWGNGILESESIISYKKNPNFASTVKKIQIVILILTVLLIQPYNVYFKRIPDDADYQPPITIRCVDSKAFGRNLLIGTCTVTNIRQYVLPSGDSEGYIIIVAFFTITFVDIAVL